MSKFTKKCMPARHSQFFDNSSEVKVVSVTGGTLRTKGGNSNE